MVLSYQQHHFPQPEAREEEKAKLSSRQLGWLRPSVSVSFSVGRAQQQASGFRAGLPLAVRVVR